LKRIYLIAALFLLAFSVLAACGGAGDDNENAQNNTGTEGGTATVEGEAIFQANCSSCHGKDLNEGYAPDLGNIGSKLSKDDIVKIVKEGRGGMPSINISDEEADAVAAWLAEKK
jgi:cytochrome c551